MRVMTFNVQHCLNYIENKIDFEIMAKTIIECGADVVGNVIMFFNRRCLLDMSTKCIDLSI
jgi:hypothetical protein